jgi:hypothetical protein
MRRRRAPAWHPDLSGWRPDGGTKGYPQVRIWHTYEDVDKSVVALKAIWEQCGQKIPVVQLMDYRETMRRTTRGVRIHFIEQLAEACPEALQFFDLGKRVSEQEPIIDADEAYQMAARPR